MISSQRVRLGKSPRSWGAVSCLIYAASYQQGRRTMLGSDGTEPIAMLSSTRVRMSHSPPRIYECMCDSRISATPYVAR